MGAQPGAVSSSKLALRHVLERVVTRKEDVVGAVDPVVAFEVHVVHISGAIRESRTPRLSIYFVVARAVGERVGRPPKLRDRRPAHVPGPANGDAESGGPRLDLGSESACFQGCRGVSQARSLSASPAPRVALPRPGMHDLARNQVNGCEPASSRGRLARWTAVPPRRHALCCGAPSGVLAARRRLPCRGRLGRGRVCGCLPPGPRRAATTTGTPHGTPRTSDLGVGNDGVVSAEVRGGRAWVRGRAKVVAVVRDRPRAPRGLCRGTCCGLPVAFPPDGMCRWGPPGALRAEGPSLSVRPVRPISMRNWRPRQGSMPRTRSSLTPTLPDPDARKRCSQSARGPSGPASFSGRL